MAGDPDIVTTGTRVVYQNRWMRVREDAIRRRDGSAGIYGVVEKPDFVVIIPIDAGRLHLVEQFRYPVGQRYWEFPQGSWEERADADPLDLARGELLEETGLDAAEMIHVGHLFVAYGYSNQGYHIFVARELRQARSDLGPEEQDLITGTFSLAEVQRMICDGEIKDAATVAALGLAHLKGLL